MASTKRKDSAEGRKEKVKKVKLDELSASKKSKKFKKLKKATPKDETPPDLSDISDDEPMEDTFGGFDDTGDASEPSSDDDEISSGMGGVALDSKTNEQSKAPKPDSTVNGATGVSKSRESHEKQKVLVQERKAAKPNADSIQRSKKLWERLRRKSHVPREERQTLVAELFEIVTGRVKDFIFKHDSVRVVQTALKYATPAQREDIAKELAGSYKQLAESKYAKFLISKFLVHGDAGIRDLIVPEFYGQVRRLIKHPEASQILDDIYRGSLATQKQKTLLLREWYGPEFALFKTKDEDKVSAELSEILEASPEKRGPIMKSLFELIKQLTEKNMSGFTMLHDAMLQYFLNALKGSEEMTEFIELVKGDEDGNLLKNLAFTKSGARLVCLTLAHGTAKDRRQILKAYKDYVTAIVQDIYGHQILLATFEVIDDTVAVSKAIFPELLGKTDEKSEQIVEYAVHLTARIPLLYIPVGRKAWLLPPDDLALLEELDTRRAATSKKQPNIRRQELLKAISGQLLQVVAHNVSTLTETSFGCQFISEVLLGCEGVKVPALQAVAEFAEGNPTSEGHVGGSSFGERMLKALILGGHYNAKTKKVDVVDPPLNFHNMLYEHIKPHILAWATGTSSFVVVALLEAEGFGHKDEVIKTLKKHQKQLEKAASEKTAEQKARREEREKSEKDKNEKKKAKKNNRNATNVGNTGSKLLLKKLE